MRWPGAGSALSPRWHGRSGAAAPSAVQRGSAAGAGRAARLPLPERSRGPPAPRRCRCRSGSAPPPRAPAAASQEERGIPRGAAPHPPAGWTSGCTPAPAGALCASALLQFSSDVGDLRLSPGTGTEEIARSIRARCQPISLTCSHPNSSSQSPLAAFAPRTCSGLDVPTPLPKLVLVCPCTGAWGNLLSRSGIYDNPGPVLC